MRYLQLNSLSIILVATYRLITVNASTFADIGNSPHHKLRKTEKRFRIDKVDATMIRNTPPSRPYGFAHLSSSSRNQKNGLKFPIFLLQQLRGGGTDAKTSVATKANTIAAASSKKKQLFASTKSMQYLCTAILTSLLGWYYREPIHTLFANLSGEKFKSNLLNVLGRVNDMGGTGVILYTIVFAIWEAFGCPTAPVETVAGMTFGVKRAIIANFVGKTSGAMLAFLFGRFLFFDAAKSKFGSNEVLILAAQSITKHPLGVSLIMRFSCFPELMKLLGLAILPVLSGYVFISIVLHGLPFTILWSMLGAEAAGLLDAEIYGNHIGYILKTIVLITAVWGCVGAPLLIGLWVKGMKNEYDVKVKK